MRSRRRSPRHRALRRRYPSGWQSSPCPALKRGFVPRRCDTFAHAAPAACAGCLSQVSSPRGVRLRGSSQR
eukprot:7391076-Prymnesium_polylepis.1